MKYLDQYQQMHSDGKFKGLTTKKYADKIGAAIAETGCKTLIDYGSGKGMQYEKPSSLHRIWGVARPTCYDPAVAGFSDYPIRGADGVLCIDVLEHIPLEELAGILTNIFILASKMVFLAVSTRPARKTMPNGLNAHVTLGEPSWWRMMAAEAIGRASFKGRLFTEFEGNEA